MVRLQNLDFTADTPINYSTAHSSGKQWCFLEETPPRAVDGFDELMFLVIEHFVVGRGHFPLRRQELT